MTDEAAKRSVYIDTNAFIYFIEGDEATAERLGRLFDFLRERPGTATTSELTLAEVLPRAEPVARRSYLDLIVWSNLLRLQPVTREILIDTSDYRRAAMRALPNGQKIMPRLPDAIHVVTAARSRCRSFLSADKSLKLPEGMVAFEPNKAGIEKLLTEIS